jgi:type IV pilus assembly protein PilC
MSRLKHALGIFATVAGLLILCLLFGLALVGAGFLLALPFLLLLMLAYGWMLSAYLHYRHSRQDELLHLLGTAAESQVPLAPALWAYLHDRPQGPLRNFWVAGLLFFMFPGYYWVWHRRHSFDQKVARVAYFLEMGDSLPSALRASPGVVSRDMALAVQVGQYTGRLPLFLRSSLPRRLAPVWLEMLPRFVYPLLLLIFLSSLTGFWMNFLLPKMERIYADFHLDLPDATQQLVTFGDQVGGVMALVPLILLGVVTLVAALFASSSLRWYLPGMGRLYRRHVQSQVLKALAALLETNTPVPRALALLADSEGFAPVAQRRLRTVCRRVEQGEPLADSLRRGGLLPASLVPLVQAAERAHNLPWALAELSETLADRIVRALRRFSQLVSPLLVLAIGVLVGFIVLGMFMPLIDLMTRLGE